MGVQVAGFDEVGDRLHAGVVRLDEEGLEADVALGDGSQLAGLDGDKKDGRGRRPAWPGKAEIIERNAPVGK